jgi:Putative abortive phage resistance protein AbiGi, antitoxin
VAKRPLTADKPTGYDLTVTDIRTILHRRTDLSTFVVHLTRKRDDTYSALDALVDIAKYNRLEARTAMGWAKLQDDPADPTRQSQRVVCFSETPLEHVHLMCGPIDNRAIALEPYGIALTKLKARKLGINPIWYVDMTTGQGDSHEWHLAKTLNGLRDAAINAAAADGDNFHDYTLAQLFPFFEQMGTWPNSKKEFWWEREWRHVGHLQLPYRGVIWLCPEDDIHQLSQRAGRELKPWLDPVWGLEEIIAHLADLPPKDVSPFV